MRLSFAATILILTILPFIYLTEKTLAHESKNSFIAKKKSKQKVMPNEKLKIKNTIVIHFKENISNTSIIDKISQLQIKYGIAIEPFFTKNLNKLVRKITYIESLENKDYLNPKHIYKIDLNYHSNTKEIMKDLKKNKLINKAYIYPKGKLSSIETIPDLSPSQNYLQNFSIDQAHRDGFWGQGTSLIDIEYHWNESHLDLNLNDNHFINSSLCQQALRNPLCPSWTAHGTAIAGILRGQNNEHGILGIAPEAKLQLYSLQNHNLADALIDILLEIENGTLPSGSTLLVQTQYPGAHNGIRIGNNSRGYLPAEVIPIHFELFELLSAFGITVIQSAGNGASSLDEEDNYLPFHINLSEQSSQAIMVASSNGRLQEKTDFTNCGQRIDFFAQGTTITTSSYPVEEGLYEWIENNNLPNFLNDDYDNYYINNFSGTSASSAIIAGIVNLMQNKVKERLGSKRSLMPFKVKEIMRESGRAIQGDCSIGRRPQLENIFQDLDQWMDSLEVQFPRLTEQNSYDLRQQSFLRLRSQGLNLDCIEHNNELSDPLCPEELVWPVNIETGIKMDFDGDGRADIMELSYFSNNGQFIRIDLSSQGENIDKFGEWDLYWNINFESIQRQLYIADMNNDKRSDFILFDSQTDAQVSIIYTTRQLLHERNNWDGINIAQRISSDRLEYEEINIPNPSLFPYLDFEIGDFDGNSWLDISTIDDLGIWRIDFNGPEGMDGNWDFEKQIVNEESNPSFSGYFFFSGHFSESPYDSMTYIKPSPEDRRLTIFEGPDFEETWDDLHFSPARLLNLSLLNEEIFFIRTGRFNLNDPYEDIIIGFRDRGLYGEFVYLFSDELFSFTHTITTPAEDDAMLAVRYIADFDGDGIDDILLSTEIGTYIHYSSEIYNDLKNELGLRQLDTVFLIDSIIIWQFAF